MQRVVLLGRQKREEAKIGLRTPLRSLTIVHRDPAVLAELEILEHYVKNELNVYEVRYDSDEAAHIEVAAKPNFPLLGKRLGRRMKQFQQAMRELGRDEIDTLQTVGTITVDGEIFTSEEIEVRQQPRPGTNTVSDGSIAVDLDTRLDDELIRGGFAREIVNRVQRRRKDMDLNVADRIEVRYRGDAELLKAAEEHRDYIMQEILAVGFTPDPELGGGVDLTVGDRPFRVVVSLAQAAPEQP